MRHPNVTRTFSSFYIISYRNMYWPCFTDSASDDTNLNVCFIVACISYLILYNILKPLEEQGMGKFG